VFSRKAPAVIADVYRRLLAAAQPDRMSDFSRLARFLTGSAVGLVLGGGGARGAAHVGTIRALTEASHSHLICVLHNNKAVLFYSLNFTTF